MARLVFVAIALFLVVELCSCRPQDGDAMAKDKIAVPAAQPTTATSSPAGNRASRLQNPTQVLNVGFDEIVVESNLQVHNRVGSKNKSKIMLPTNSTSSANKSKSLVI